MPNSCTIQTRSEHSSPCSKSITVAWWLTKKPECTFPLFLYAIYFRILEPLDFWRENYCKSDVIFIFLFYHNDWRHLWLLQTRMRTSNFQIYEKQLKCVWLNVRHNSTTFIKKLWILMNTFLKNCLKPYEMVTLITTLTNLFEFPVMIRK